ncbi:phosphatase PAP2 family protein [Legionella sp. PC997]|uniref:phosphatase PAP2 family protein n=1 Tax=Legionella sp. PC997 TaxID=2755562 RepID=UPI0015FD418B|nr:phosphatase PAP2 family protein [Legionella sp. PC997]QMT60822.1 phosphatase PAP2 family protein [Legionella sp. PC997]
MMKEIIRNNSFYLLIGGILSLFLFTVLLFAVYSQSSFLSINHELYLLSNKIQNNSTHILSNFISLFGDKYIIVPSFISTGAILYIKNQKWIGLHLIGVISIAALLAYIFKNVIAVPRPEIITSTLHSYAFPSRHVTLCSAYVTLLTSLIVPQMKRPWFGVIIAGFLIILESYSRIALQVHWLSDVLGGALLGVSCGLLGAYSFFRKPKTPLNIKFIVTTLLITFLIFSFICLGLDFCDL